MGLVCNEERVTNQMNYWVCHEVVAHPLLSHIYIYYSFCPPKARSIFGLHRKRQCQKFRLGPDCVGITFVYVPLHSLGGYNVFVA